MEKLLYIVIPCYNEQEILFNTAEVIESKLNALIESKTIHGDSKILFVNDGSQDATWSIISELCNSQECFLGINLSKNFGHQNALMAGLMLAKDYADMIVSMDADLQDDIDAIDEMIAKFNCGNDIVYGVRRKRENDSWFKRFSAEKFYWMMNLLGSKIIYNHADYRLMSKRALNTLAEFKEVNLFLRGMIPMLGYPYEIVYYDRKSREAGYSKYPLTKMLLFALEGITSCSVRLINFITLCGLFISISSIGFLFFILMAKINGNVISGWTSLVVSLWFLGGIQMFFMGIIGEYIGKIYLETKERPRYIIKDILK